MTSQERRWPPEARPGKETYSVLESAEETALFTLQLYPNDTDFGPLAFSTLNEHMCALRH